MPITKATSNAVAPAAKGDLVVGNATNDSSVLAVGSTDQVLTVDSSTATGLKWATASAGGMTLLSTTSLTGSSVTVSSISQAYNTLQIVVEDLYISTNEESVYFRYNADSGANRHQQVQSMAASASQPFNLTSVTFAYGVSNNASYKKMVIMNIPNYANTTNLKYGTINTTGFNAYNLPEGTTSFYIAGYNQAVAISSVYLFPGAGTFSGGTMKIYGVK
jgi:hypothetical protein